MTKIDTLSAALTIEATARQEIAFCKGQIGRCHRKTIAHLMPKFETPEERDAYARGFADVEAKLTAE